MDYFYIMRGGGGGDTGQAERVRRVSLRVKRCWLMMGVANIVSIKFYANCCLKQQVFVILICSKKFSYIFITRPCTLAYYYIQAYADI